MSTVSNLIGPSGVLPPQGLAAIDMQQLPDVTDAPKHDVYLHCKKTFTPGDIVFVGSVKHAYDKPETVFVSATPTAHRRTKNAEPEWLFWGEFDEVWAGRHVTAYGAFEVKEYFPLTLRVWLEPQFKDDLSIKSSLERAGYGGHRIWPIAALQFHDWTGKES